MADDGEANESRTPPGGEHAGTPDQRVIWPATAAVYAFGALVWSVPFLIRLRREPARWWITRDDAVITLSHARNFADHGTIGVSPGGDRVEGFSSPLHFAVASVLERFGDHTAEALTLWILSIGLVVSGVAMTWGVRHRIRRLGARHAELVALAAVAALGALTAIPWTTTGWLGSGMENPLILLSMCTIAGAALAGLDRPIAQWTAIVGSVLLMVSRVEFAAVCGPVLLALMASDSSWNGWPSRRAAVRFVVLPLTVTLFVHVARRWYFGAWLPNTAIVQDRGAGISQLATTLVVSAGFAALLVRARATPSTPRRSVGAVATAVAWGSGAALMWLEATGRTGQSVSSLLLVPGIAVFGLVVAGGLFARWWLGAGRAGPAHWVFAALAVMPMTQYVVAGPARLDDNRISGLAVPVLIWWSGLVWAQVVLVARRRSEEQWRRRRTPALLLAATVLLLGAGFTGRTDGARSLNYEIAWADELVELTREIRDADFDGEGLVITATPDLGKYSFAKVASVVDLGWLGDPLFATLRADRPDLMDAYLLRIAVPDLVATSGGWSCDYRGWLEHPGFVAEYELVGDPGADWRRGPEICPADGLQARWQRVRDGGEFELTRALLAAADPIGVVDDALADCVNQPGDSLRCQPVRRSVQRAAEHLRSGGALDDVIARFAVSPSARFDQLVLQRGPAWWEEAAGEVVALLDEPAA